MRRRQFIGGLAGTIVWPLTAEAQQATVPVIGFLSSGSVNAYADLIAALREGLNETGYTDGRNVAIESLGADGQFDQTERLAAEFANRGVAVIVTSGNGSSLAAQSAAPAVPLVFLSQGDPLSFGLVRSLSRPEGNSTGVALLAVDLLGKRLEVARQLAPMTSRIAVLFNSRGPEAEAQRVELKEVSHRLVGQIEVISVSSDGQ